VHVQSRNGFNNSKHILRIDSLDGHSDVWNSIQIGLVVFGGVGCDIWRQPLTLASASNTAYCVRYHGYDWNFNEIFWKENYIRHWYHVIVWDWSVTFLLLVYCSGHQPVNVYFFRFFLASFYTKYDQYHFVVNAVSLLAVLIPKLPQFDGVRLFGINAYWLRRVVDRVLNRWWVNWQTDCEMGWWCISVVLLG